MYQTTNGGSNWAGTRTKSQDLHGIYFTDENTGYAVGSNGNIIKTTNGGGDPIGIEPLNNEIPERFELFQNYPNPFNPMTNVKIQMPKSGFVSLKVFDIMGREVENLVEENLKAGSYELEFNGMNRASGIYYYKL